MATGFLIGAIATLDITALQYSVGAILGIIFTPDLDVDAGFIGNTIIRKKLGKFAENLWDRFWYWYRRSLKHGSPLSHLPIISTLGRIGYIYFVLIVIPHVIIKYVFSLDWNLNYVLSWYWSVITSPYKIIIGLMASDLIHWTLDVCTTEHKNVK